jgi:hypothetical protein
MDRFEEDERFRMLCAVRQAYRQTDSGNILQRIRGGETPARRPTFREAITIAEEQIGLAEYPRERELWRILHDLCRTMAEVYMMAPTARIKVAGEELEAGMVAEVFCEVTPEMAETLAEELKGSIADVRCLKAYLRSALYNKVFEFEACEARLDEQVKRDMGWRR